MGWFGFRVEAFGCIRFRVLVLGLRLWCVFGLGFRVEGLGCVPVSYDHTRAIKQWDTSQRRDLCAVLLYPEIQEYTLNHPRSSGFDHNLRYIYIP